MYSVLSNAYNSYKFDNPQQELLPWSEAGAIEAFNIFKPYLKIMKDCGTRDNSCYKADMIKQISNSGSTNYGTHSSYYKAVLSDGSLLIFRGSEEYNSVLEVFFDINGSDGPNTWCKDLFAFIIHPTSNIVTPEGYNNTGDLDKSRYGACTAWVVYNKNMDYLHCKGLKMNKHTSCKDLKK